MIGREERIEVFRDTLEWVEQNPVLSKSIAEAKKNTKVYYEDEYPRFDRFEDSYEIFVSKERSFQAAIRLRRESPDARIAVMNFANAFRPGGGVKTGAGAQEESLCRTSTLYPLLYRKSLHTLFYKYHEMKGSPKATDSLIYTKGVIICKTDEELPMRMAEDDWVNVDVITVAAPDLRSKHNIHMPLAVNGLSMTDHELFGYHVKRAMHILTCAAANDADILILGAFGCGAFQNNPEVVSNAYRVALSQFPKVFKSIVFAVYDPSLKGGNFEVFNSILGDLK